MVKADAPVTLSNEITGVIVASPLAMPVPLPTGRVQEVSL